MPALPALLGRPLLVTGPAQAADLRVLQLDLTVGLPARLALDATRSLVLAVPLGVARAVLAADPLAVVVETGDPAMGVAPHERRDTDRCWPRLTLVDAGRIGDTVPVVVGVPMRLGRDGAAVVEVLVDHLRVTAGSLRSPGRYGSRIVLFWRDLQRAPDRGPPAAVGDPSIPPH